MNELKELLDKGIKLTPMMEQYVQVKSNYKDIILMYRMGDFYELFFEDAKVASKLLNITLTQRGKIQGIPIPMSGIPHHAASNYIDRLTSLGMKVAICEQIEDPKEAKGIVKRAVTQVVSPGIPYDLDKDDKSENKFIASAYEFNKTYYLTLIDYTTGEFFGLCVQSFYELLEKLQVYAPKEFITYLGQWDHFEILDKFLEEKNILKTHLSEDYFNEKYTELYINKLIPNYKFDEILKLHPSILSPVGAISYYITSTQSLDELMHIKPFKLLNNEDEMKITYSTLQGLELLPKSKERYKDSILGFMDKTRTSMGGRKLRTLFYSPLRDLKEIYKRQESLDYFLANTKLHADLREELFEIRDIERIMAKLTTGKLNAGDLLNLAYAIMFFDKTTKTLKGFPDIYNKNSSSKEKALLKLANKILDTINDEVGASLEKGNLIRIGSSAERDRLASLVNDASLAFIDLEKKYRDETGIGNLKIKYNNIAGYFVEVSKSHTSKVPENFTRRQTLVNSERYHTEELKVLEDEVLSASDKLNKLEREIFNTIIENINELNSEIQIIADGISMIDVMQSLAFVAIQNDFTKPIFNKKKKILQIEKGFHPLIKNNIKDLFVPHDLTLDEKTYFGLITGPNMAGKTTVMREASIIQFLAQIGSYVPAQKAVLHPVDYIFSRLGAHDDIIKGQSTFMVEMSETAEILHHATENSLIILDEIGRGTSTYDGLSIAWALVEHIVKKIKAITLFSTHYHELIDLVSTLEGAKNLTVKTTNENGHVEFLYKLIEEGAHQSYGIHVAKLAGFPAHILNRSTEILKELEKNHNHSQNLIDVKSPNKNIHNDNQLNIFERTEVVYQNEDHPLVKEFKDLDIQNMTPIEALNKLHNLKEAFKH